MLVATLTILFSSQDPSPAPTPIKAPTEAPVASQAISTEVESLDLGNGCKLQGRVLRTTEQAIFLDVGYDVLKVPTAAVVRRESVDGKKSDLEWSAGLSIGTSRDEEAHTAVIELAIGSKDVTKALTAETRLPLALYRMEGKSKRKYLAWSPTRTKTPNFHVPDAFGALLLDR